MFDDQVGNYDEAFKYYFDVILKPFSKFMLKAIEKIRPLPIEIICNGHGPILRSTWKEKIDRSEKYAKEYLEKQGSEQKNILIAYVSAYGYTKIMAENIAKGIRENSNYEVDVTDIENILLGDLDEKLTKANAIIVGSPTINQNTLLPVYKLFALINPIRDRGKLAAAFGSYGWSGEAVGLIENHLKNLKLKIFCQGLASKFYPHNGKAEQFIAFGKTFAMELAKEKVVEPD